MGGGAVSELQPRDFAFFQSIGCIRFKVVTAFVLLIDLHSVFYPKARQFEVYIQNLVEEAIEKEVKKKHGLVVYHSLQHRVVVAGAIKYADLVIWVENTITHTTKAVLIEVKNYESTPIRNQAVDQIRLYKHHLERINDWAVAAVVPILCCRESTKISPSALQQLKSDGVNIRRFENDSFTCKENRLTGGLTQSEKEFITLIADLVNSLIDEDDAWFVEDN